jgi:hypothetical protein
MHIKRFLLYALIILLLCVMIVITYGSIHVASDYDIASRFIQYMNSFTFRHGITTGFLGYLFLTSILLLFFTIARGISSKKLSLMLISSFLGLAYFWSTKAQDSDTWWVGVTTGYLICEAIILPLTIYITYKFINKT